MLLSTLTRKSITDLTRRRARSLFAIATLALAVASVGIFGVPTLMDKAMQHEVAANRLADISVNTNPVRLDAAQLGALRHLDNVAAVQPKTIFPTRIYIGARREKALVYGIPSFARQAVDVVALESGRMPGTGHGVLTEIQNSKKDKFEGAPGGRVQIVGANGKVESLPITGTARNLGGGSLVASGYVVLYASSGTVQQLSGAAGYNWLGFRLADSSGVAADRTLTSIRKALHRVPGFTGFTDLPTTREPGSYPGKESFDQLASLFAVVSVLAIVSALVLLASTMTTLIAEQTGEIATMKAIGARRAQIRRVYLTTALLLGGVAALLGAVLGVLLANWLTSYFGSALFGIEAGFAVPGGVVVAMLIVGLAGPALAALSAIRRASRISVREALAASGSALPVPGRLDGLLRDVAFLPRSVQIGLRSVTRRKRRTLATALQVALAVATLLAFLAVGTGVSKMTHAGWQDSRWDVMVAAATGHAFDAKAADVARSTPGVRSAQPMLMNATKVLDRTGRTTEDAEVWGVPPRPLFSTAVSEGRWYTAAEVASRARVAVLARNLARVTDKHVGDRITLTTAGGPARFRVVGISPAQPTCSPPCEGLHDGWVVMTPLASLQRVLGHNEANVFWLRTASSAHGFVDRTTSGVEDALAASGNQPSTLIHYVGERDSVAANKQITTVITILGLLIVAISMVGLVNAITMGVLERTREIGVLRSIGARGRDIRRIFAAEGVTVALIGWAAGIPLGYALAKGVIALIRATLNIEVVSVFPVTHILLALAGTVILALLVLGPPVRRAARFRPGEALRYG